MKPDLQPPFAEHAGHALGMTAVLSLLFSFTPSLSINNLINVIHQGSIKFVLAAGMTFVILTGGIDLAVGSDEWKELPPKEFQVELSVYVAHTGSGSPYWKYNIMNSTDQKRQVEWNTGTAQIGSRKI